VSARSEAQRGLVVRLARTAAQDLLGLRGGVLTQHWVGEARRRADDIDYIGLYPWSVARTAALVRDAMALSLGDGAAFDAAGLVAAPLWPDSPFPGTRLQVPVRCRGAALVLQVDVGHGDPLVPPARPERFELASGEAADVRIVEPELMVAWKAHGLFEFGLGRWRGKDLWDLALLFRHAPLREDVLVAAVRTAFGSRGLSLRVADRLLGGEFGQSRGGRRTWRQFLDEQPGMDLPADGSEVIAEVAAALRPVWTRLGVWP
jgi:hypothetical protein